MKPPILATKANRKIGPEMTALISSHRWEWASDTAALVPLKNRAIFSDNYRMKWFIVSVLSLK